MDVMYAGNAGAFTCPPFGPAVLFKFVPDELVRKNLAAPGKLLLRCSTIGTPHRYIPVGDLDRSPLIREPLNKSYGDHWLTAQFGIKAPLRRHAVACQEVATPSPNCAVSPGGRVLRHAAAALQPSPRAMAIAFGLRLASTCLRARRDPIGLVQRFLSYGYASAGDQPTLFAIFLLTNSSGTNLNSSAGPKGVGQDARSRFVPFTQHPG
jgi:hypothetical protein